MVPVVPGKLLSFASLFTIRLKFIDVIFFYERMKFLYQLGDKLTGDLNQYFTRFQEIRDAYTCRKDIYGTDLSGQRSGPGYKADHT